MQSKVFISTHGRSQWEESPLWFFTLSNFHFDSNGGISEFHFDTDIWLKMWNSANSSNSYVASDYSCSLGTRFIAGYCYLNIRIRVMVRYRRTEVENGNFLLGYYSHYWNRYNLYTWVKRSTVRVKCLAKKHNTMTPARAQTRTTQSGVERTNPEATVPPHMTEILITW